MNLDTREARLEYLNKFTQNYTTQEGFVVGDTNAVGGDNCGATALIAGAIVAGGEQGIQHVITMVDGTVGKDEFYKKYLDEVKYKILSEQGLNHSDIRLVQETLHVHLRRKQEEAGYRMDIPGVHKRIIKEAINSSPDMQALYDDNVSINYAMP